jgi:hypothetical protein
LRELCLRYFQPHDHAYHGHGECSLIECGECDSDRSDEIVILVRFKMLRPWAPPPILEVERAEEHFQNCQVTKKHEHGLCILMWKGSRVANEPDWHDCIEWKQKLEKTYVGRQDCAVQLLLLQEKWMNSLIFRLRIICPIL